MEITKELANSVLTDFEGRLKSAEASVNILTGAVNMLKDMIKYLDRDPVKEEEARVAKAAEEQKHREEISDENAAIQARDEAALKSNPPKEALSLKELAELIGGPGAVADEPRPITPAEAEYITTQRGY